MNREYEESPDWGTRKRKKKKSRHSDVFYIFIALLVFIFIGLTISFTIRACVHHQKSVIKEMVNSAINQIGNESESFQEVNSQYAMPDSIVLMCKPKPLDGIPETILKKTSYVASYNQETRLPNWVAWNLSAEHTDGPYKRCDNFYEEESVPRPRATIEDYRGCGWSRGHMCPAGDNKWDGKAMFDTFSLVNVCPQNSKFNSGIWNSIEIDCRHWARRYGDIYIVCGPVFLNSEHKTIGNNRVLVPEAFFKVVLCLNGKPKGIGFIVRNTEGIKKNDLYYNSIDQVERITGIDFFPILPDDIENMVESVADINEWS